MRDSHLQAAMKEVKNYIFASTTVGVSTTRKKQRGQRVRFNRSDVILEKANNVTIFIKLHVKASIQFYYNCVTQYIPSLN